MTKKSRRIPAYVLHKPTGQARVRINGKNYYLGKHGTPESHARYDELIAEQVIGKESLPPKTLMGVLAAWWPECKRRYGKSGKGPCGGAGNWRPIIRLLRTHHGNRPADQLGPVALRRLIEEEARRKNWSLTHARKNLSRAKAIYKWAKNEELVSPLAFGRLKDVEIREGRATKPLGPLPDKLLEQTLPHLCPTVRAMVKLQRLSGCRPGELVIMRPCDIDRSGDVWRYRPVTHKTEHRGKTRVVYIGPKAQTLLAPYLLRPSSAFCFCPQESEQKRRGQLHEERKTPLSCGNKPGTNRKVEPLRSAGQRYTTDSYARHIRRACERNGLPVWSPNQLRKAAATEIRHVLDVESSAAVLGHSASVVTARHYAARDEERAMAAVRRLG